MNTKNLELVLDDMELPSIDLGISTSVSEEEATGDVKFDSIPEILENQILAEGAAELNDHPQLENFLEVLNDLKNEFHQNVKDASHDFELNGFVKVLFSTRENKPL